MNSIEDLLNSLLQNSPDNTVRAASGGLMGSPMQNSPMSGPTPPMGGQSQQNNPMSGPTPFMGGPLQQPGGMGGGGMQPNLTMPVYTPTGPTSTPLGSMGKPEGMESYLESLKGEMQSMPQMGGMSPSYGGGIGSLMPQQSLYGEQPKQQEMQALMEERRRQEMQALMERGQQFDQQRGPNPYQTATPLNPNDPMIARTRGVSGGQQRMNPFQQLMGESRGMRAATQPYTPVQGQRLTPGATPQNPNFSRTPGNFAMPVQGQNNTSGKQSLNDLINASNVSSAGRRRLV